MFTPEFLTVAGTILTVISAFALWVAGSIRDWFFGPELRDGLLRTQD